MEQLPKTKERGRPESPKGPRSLKVMVYMDWELRKMLDKRRGHTAASTYIYSLIEKDVKNVEK